MLLEDFYKVLESRVYEETVFEVRVKIHKDHDIFKGHFPNFPVTPGVAMLQIIKNSLENHLKKSLFLQSSSSIKFLALVNPNEQNILIFNIKYAIDNELIVSTINTSFIDGSAVLKCNATFVKN